MAQSPRDIDGVQEFFGFEWESPHRLRMTIQPRHINRAGLLSGVATYSLVDYCMGSALWVERSGDERIATISISINYIRTATEGDVICTTELDRRNDRVAVLRSEVCHEDGRLIATAIGSYSIFPKDRLPAQPAT
jgi:uncharacterized protein (TIGR00369 family)